MRRGGWLIAFARADGPAFARALALLLFLAGFASGMHAGFAAAPGVAAAVLCHGAADGPGPVPAADHEHDCCLAGTAPMALPHAPPAAGAAILPASHAFQPEGQFPPAHSVLTRAGPRAPPALPA
jgi:hypothetical protein